jgi:hypothetical protein
MRIDIKNEETVVRGDIAYCRGTFTRVMTPKAGGASVNYDGKFLTILKRQGDGTRKIYRDCFNSNVPPRQERRRRGRGRQLHVCLPPSPACLAFQDCIEFASKNPTGFLATVDGTRPRVRVIMLWRADPSGLYFETFKSRQVRDQLTENPSVEVCFFNRRDDAVEDPALPRRSTGRRPARSRAARSSNDGRRRIRLAAAWRPSLRGYARRVFWISDSGSCRRGNPAGLRYRFFRVRSRRPRSRRSCSAGRRATPQGQLRVFASKPAGTC